MKAKTRLLSPWRVAQSSMGSAVQVKSSPGPSSYLYRSLRKDRSCRHRLQTGPLPQTMSISQAREHHEPRRIRSAVPCRTFGTLAVVTSIKASEAVFISCNWWHCCNFQQHDSARLSTTWESWQPTSTGSSGGSSTWPHPASRNTPFISQEDKVWPSCLLIIFIVRNWDLRPRCCLALDFAPAKNGLKCLKSIENRKSGHCVSIPGSELLTARALSQFQALPWSPPLHHHLHHRGWQPWNCLAQLGANGSRSCTPKPRVTCRHTIATSGLPAPATCHGVTSQVLQSIHWKHNQHNQVLKAR